VADVQKEQC
jgi:hypothetical protein